MDKINVDVLTKYQPLSEEFISQYHELFGMYWRNIVYYQKLSLDFLIKHKDKFSLKDLELGNVCEQTIIDFKMLIKMGIV